jgi:uncharacterized protein (TIGR02271 family)
VRLEDGSEYLVPAKFFGTRSDGSLYLDLDDDELKPYRTGGTAGPAPSFGETLTTIESDTIPVVEEEVTVGKRTRESRVRVQKHVSTREVAVDALVVREEFEIRRVPINRIIDEPVAPRQEGDTYVIPLFEEVLVTEKRLLLREDVHIVRRREESHHPRTETLRKEEVEVQRVDPNLDAQHARNGEHEWQKP